MASVSLIDPYSQQAEKIARQKRMAQALQESGSQVLQMPTTPGVLISPIAGLAKVLESGLGAYQEAKAEKDYAALQDKYRTNYNTQLGEMARLISAPEVKGVAGQEFVADKPAVMAPKIKQGFGGYGMPQEDGQYEVSPAVPGQAAVAPVEARPAGYISAADLQKIDIPEVKQLLMAKYLKQFEPEQVTLGDNQRLLERTGGGGFKEVVGAAKTPTTATLSPLGKLQSERAAIAATNPNDPRLATYDNAIAKESQDQNLVFQKEKFEYEKGNPGFTLEKVRNADGSESVMAVNKGSAVARTVMGADGKALTSAALEKTPHYSEIENNGRVVIVDLSLPAKDRLANAQDKGPIRNNLEKITTTDANGREVSRYVDKTTLATLGDIPAPYKGFMSDLADAGQLPPNWQSIPQIAGLVRENLINKAGGITQADLASLKVRIAEASARLGYEGIPFDSKGLTPTLPNFTTLSGGGSAANAAAPKITTQAEIAEAAKRSGKSIEQVTRDAVAKGYKVQ
jgi:hypothetical protein